MFQNSNLIGKNYFLVKTAPKVRLYTLELPSMRVFRQNSLGN